MERHRAKLIDGITDACSFHAEMKIIIISSPLRSWRLHANLSQRFLPRLCYPWYWVLTALTRQLTGSRWRKGLFWHLVRGNRVHHGREAPSCGHVRLFAHIWKTRKQEEIKDLPNSLSLLPFIPFEAQPMGRFSSHLGWIVSPQLLHFENASPKTNPKLCLTKSLSI